MSVPVRIDPICISQAIAKWGVTFQTAGFVVKNSDLSIMLENPWSLSLSLVNNTSLENFAFRLYAKKGTQNKGHKKLKIELKIKGIKLPVLSTYP